MKEKPILFSGAMVRAILEGRKTQTRRICSPQPFLPPGKYRYDGEMEDGHALELLDDGKPTEKYIQCPKPPYLPGDRLWVRETWSAPHKFDHLRPRLIPQDASFHYAATEERGGLRWRPNIHMPRAASRITLEVTDVRAEQVQSISEADAQAEGVDRQFRIAVMRLDGGPDYQIRESYRGGFANAWSDLYPGAWESNPWVWVICFKVLEVKG